VPFLDTAIPLPSLLKPPVQFPPSLPVPSLPASIATSSSSPSVSSPSRVPSLSVGGGQFLGPSVGQFNPDLGANPMGFVFPFASFASPFLPAVSMGLPTTPLPNASEENLQT
jgi:hypothetical protein